jgi:hypothetical protein
MTIDGQQIILRISESGVPLCSAHYQKYIDDPSQEASRRDYDAWFQAHGVEMSCMRCRSHDDTRGDQMDVVFSGAISSEGRQRNKSTGHAGQQVTSISPAFVRYWQREQVMRTA